MHQLKDRLTRLFAKTRSRLSWREEVRILRKSGTFDEAYYLAHNPDVAREQLDPLAHYVLRGAAEGRNPSAVFETSFYLERDPGLVAWDKTPLLHYVLYGQPEGRPSRAESPSDSMTPSTIPPAVAELVASLDQFRDCPRRALLIEPTPAHQEIFPTILHFFSRLGFHVDILTRDTALPHRRIEDALRSSWPSERVHCVLNADNAPFVFDALRNLQYDVVFFTTLFQYWLDDGLLDRVSLPVENMYAYVHELPLKARREGDLHYFQLPDERLFTLTPTMAATSGLRLLTPSYFPSSADNKRPLFEPGMRLRLAVPGKVDAHRRDYRSLLEACRTLRGKLPESDRFEFTVLGGEGDNVDDFADFTEAVEAEGLSKNIRVCANLGFSELFYELERCHLLLPLLDPSHAPHQCYLHDKTSGSLNLALGFGLPLIMHEDFAQAWGVEDLTLTHTSEQGLAAVIEAIVRDPSAYASRRLRIREYNTALLEQSFENFKAAIEAPRGEQFTQPPKRQSPMAFDGPLDNDRISALRRLVWWWTPHTGEGQNAGDFISPYLVRELVPSIALHDAQSTRVFVGSVVDRRLERIAEPGSQVEIWGAGMRGERRFDRGAYADVRFHAVRGPLTRALMELPPDLPLGDPALLLPRMFEPTVRRASAPPLLVCHMDHGPEVAPELGFEHNHINAHIESSFGALEEFIERIFASEFVLTTALHGAVIAAAYGTPFAYATSSAGIDCPFKWCDFSMSINMPTEFHSSLDAGRRWYERNRNSLEMPNLDRLAACCPLPLFEES